MPVRRRERFVDAGETGGPRTVPVRRRPPPPPPPRITTPLVRLTGNQTRPPTRNTRENIARHDPDAPNASGNARLHNSNTVVPRAERDIARNANSTSLTDAQAERLLYARSNLQDEETIEIDRGGITIFGTRRGDQVRVEMRPGPLYEQGMQIYHASERNRSNFVMNQGWYGSNGWRFQNEQEFREYIIGQAENYGISLPNTSSTYVLASRLQRGLNSLGESVAPGVGLPLNDYLTFDPLSPAQRREITSRNVDAIVTQEMLRNPFPARRGVEEFVRLSDAVAGRVDNNATDYMHQMNRVLLGYPSSGDLGTVASMFFIGPDQAQFRIADEDLHPDYTDIDPAPHQISFHTWSYVATTATPWQHALVDELAMIGNVFHELPSVPLVQQVLGWHDPYASEEDYQASVVGMYLGSQIAGGRLQPEDVGSEFRRLFTNSYEQAYSEIMFSIR